MTGGAVFIFKLRFAVHLNGHAEDRECEGRRNEGLYKTAQLDLIDGSRVPIHRLWMRRHTIKFNGVSYPVQVAAAAVYSPKGKTQVRQLIDYYYMENARLIRAGLSRCGFKVFGGINAPYIWLKTPAGMTSWDFFDRLLQKTNVVGTLGSGFGPTGEGYFRLSAFGQRADVEEALKRIEKTAM